MRTNFKTFIGVITLSAALAVLVSPAVQASPPQTASGDFVVEDLVINSVEPKGEITHIELTATFRLEGDFEGTFVADFLIVHLGPSDQPAEEIFVAQGTFTGKVYGADGSFDFTFVGTIDADGQAEGELVIGRGTDDLENLSGQITLSGISGVAGNYEGSIHFAP
jgi:hypothetical protein